MDSYCLKAVKNYKDIFQLICSAEKEHFNSRSYFYYINNEINPLTVSVDLSQVPSIITKGQSHAELTEELWDRTE